MQFTVASQPTPHQSPAVTASPQGEAFVSLAMKQGLFHFVGDLFSRPYIIIIAAGNPLIFNFPFSIFHCFQLYHQQVQETAQAVEASEQVFPALGKGRHGRKFRLPCKASGLIHLQQEQTVRRTGHKMGLAVEILGAVRATSQFLLCQP